MDCRYPGGELPYCRLVFWLARCREAFRIAGARFEGVASRLLEVARGSKKVGHLAPSSKYLQYFVQTDRNLSCKGILLSPRQVRQSSTELHDSIRTDSVKVEMKKMRRNQQVKSERTWGVWGRSTGAGV